MALAHIKKQFSISIQAHRGYKLKYPENTLLAFQKAIECKADYVELDVHLTKDRKLVVIHDYKTGRVADKDLVIKDTTLNELKKLDFHENQQIPTLREVFELCKGKIGINIELKHKGLAEMVNALILEFGMDNDVMISSFVHSEVEKIKELNPKLLCATLEPRALSAIGYVLKFFTRYHMINHAKKLQMDAIHPFSKYVSVKFCKIAHEKSLLVNPWTSDTPKDWDKLIEAGVDSIITNNPEQLYQYLSKK